MYGTGKGNETKGEMEQLGKQDQMWGSDTTHRGGGGGGGVWAGGGRIRIPEEGALRTTDNGLGHTPPTGKAKGARIIKAFIKKWE